MENITYIELTESVYLEDKLGVIKNLYPTEFSAKSNEGSIVILEPNTKKALHYIDVSSNLTEQDMQDLKELCSKEDDIYGLYKFTSNRINIKDYLNLKVQNNITKLLEYVRAEKTYLEKQIIAHGEAIYHKEKLHDIIEGIEKFEVYYDSKKLTGKIVLSSKDLNDNYRLNLEKWCMIYEVFYYESSHPILNREVVIDGEPYFVPNNKLTDFFEILRDYI